MTIDVSNNNPRVEYSVAQGVTQTVFAVPFDYFEDSDVTIYVDGVAKVLGTDYTMTGGDGSTGTITFVTATPPDVQQVTGATGGSTVVIVRHVALERVTDFVAGQDINRAALNTQLDTIVAQIADLDDKVDRTLHITDYEVNPGTALPSIDARKGRVIAFNSTTGAIEAGPTSNDISTIATNISAILQSSTDASNAAASASAAASSATSASTSESSAASSASSASASAATATTKAAEASTSATNAATSATAAQAAQTAAEAAKTAAETAQAGAETSEINAASSATSASSGASSASASATSATASQTAAAASATAASASETAAAASEAAASTSETNAAASASTASTAATTATTQATAAATSATNAATSASSAATSATSASSSATAAQAAQTSAEAAYDSFDDRYLGAKTSVPTTDNDGDPLLTGALYYNTTASQLYIWNGSAWDDAAFTAAGSAVTSFNTRTGAVTLNSTDVANAFGLLSTNNLSDLSNTATARTNLGLGTAATTASTDYATAAQGALADSALQSSDIGVSVQGYSAVLSGTTASYTTAEETKLAGIEAGATADQTAGEILTAIKTVDGAASGLDADLLDGQHGSYYLDGNNFINLPAGYTGWTVSDGTNSENVADGNTVTFSGSGSASVSYNTTTNTLTVSATDTNTTYSAGSGLSLAGTVFSHTDTSSQSSVNNSGNSVIQDVTLDTYGHVTALASATIIAPTANGTSGQVLTSNGTTTPVWATPVSGGSWTTASPVTLSGNSVTLTGIPSGVDEFEFYLISASSNAYYLPRFRLGTSGGIVSSGYTSSPANSGYISGYSGYGNITDGFYYSLNFTAVHQMGWKGFRKPSSNTWIVNGYGSANSSGVSLYGGGEVTLSGDLSQIFLGFQYTSSATWTGGTVTLRYK